VLSLHLTLLPSSILLRSNDATISPYFATHTFNRSPAYVQLVVFVLNCVFMHRTILVTVVENCNFNWCDPGGNCKEYSVYTEQLGLDRSKR